MSADLAKLFRTTEEQVKPIKATVIGTIPEWLNGSYLRNGPGVFDVKNFTVNHWCDGFGVVYKFHIHKGEVTFSKRIIQSDAYKKAVSVGKPVFTEFGTKAYSDSTKSLFQKMVSTVVPELTDNVGTNLFKLGDSIYLATESCNMRILDPENLTTEKKVDVSQYVNLNRLCSHVFTEEDGTSYTLGSAFTNNFKCTVVKIPPHNVTTKEFKNAQVLCSIPNRISSYSSYFHSFGLTKNYIIYIEQPLFVNNLKLTTAHLKGKCLLECMEWNPKESTRFILVNKESGKISPIVYEADTPFFFLHIINSYEKDNEIIVDVVCHDSHEVLETLYLNQVRNLNFDIKDKATARRYILPIAENIQDLMPNDNLVKTDQRLNTSRKGNKVIVTGYKLTTPHFDFPTINKSYIGKEYKYLYASGLYGPSKYQACILKVDVTSEEILTWKEDDNVMPGEAAFVPRPGSTDEDDGLLLIGVTDTRPGKKDFLLILDAKNLNEVARAEVDSHVPHLIHAYFLPDSS